jgi:hypothetical protein
MRVRLLSAWRLHSRSARCSCSDPRAAHLLRAAAGDRAGAAGSGRRTVVAWRPRGASSVGGLGRRAKVVRTQTGHSRQHRWPHCWPCWHSRRRLAPSVVPLRPRNQSPPSRSRTSSAAPSRRAACRRREPRLRHRSLGWPRRRCLGRPRRRTGRQVRSRRSPSRSGRGSTGRRRARSRAARTGRTRARARWRPLRGCRTHGRCSARSRARNRHGSSPAPPRVDASRR